MEKQTDPPLRTIPDHAWRWIKVVCGVALAVRVLQYYHLCRIIPAPFFSFMTLLGLALAALGLGVRLWHYGLLKKSFENIYQPSRLLKSGGLFGLIRHPLYLGDITAFWGLYLIYPDRLAGALFLLGFLALLRQTTTEEKVLSSLFEDEFKAWSARTRYMLPYIF